MTLTFELFTSNLFHYLYCCPALCFY